MPTPEYAAYVDAFAKRIASGELKPGDRLPPQRTFAYDSGIAVSTAGRVYSELLRRGLVVGEVGRGTFVAGAAPSGPTFRSEPLDGRIDLDFNFPTIPEQAALIAKSMSGLHRVDVLSAAMAPITMRRIDAARTVVASFVASAHWRPQPDAFVLTGCGRQSIAAAISALVPVGGRLAVEAISYPLVKSTAARLGITIVPIGLDAEGPLPEHIARAHRAGALSAIYLQPVMHNPLGHTIGAKRRGELIRLASKLDIFIVEDLVYGFLSDTPPMAAEAPDRCLVVDSLSKRVASGMALGWLAVPRTLRDRVAAAMRAGAWHADPFALEISVRMMSDGTASQIARMKRLDAGRRQAIVADTLKDFERDAHPGSYHVWLRLPEGWRSEAFAAAAARAGVSLTPSSAFAMTPGHAPNAVRLALGLPTAAELKLALGRLRELLRSGPDTIDITE